MFPHWIVSKTVIKGVMVTFHRDDCTICVHTDASNVYWAALVAQACLNETSKPPAEQRHSPMKFSGSAFVESQINWSTFEKKAFAVYQIFKKLECLLTVHQNIRVFQDHRKLLLVFNLKALEPSPGRHIVSKVRH